MFSHTGSNAFPVSFLETVSLYSVVLPSYLFSVLHYGSTVFHSQLQEKVCGDFFFFFAFPSPQLENMRQILFMYAVTSKGADMLLSLKKNPELFILQKSTRALNWKAPRALQANCGELSAALPGLFQNIRQRLLLLNLPPALQEQTRCQIFAFIRNQGSSSFV